MKAGGEGEMGEQSWFYMVDFLQEVRTQGDAQRLSRAVLLIGFRYGANQR